MAKTIRSKLEGKVIQEVSMRDDLLVLILDDGTKVEISSREFVSIVVTDPILLSIQNSVVGQQSKFKPAGENAKFGAG